MRIVCRALVALSITGGFIAAAATAAHAGLTTNHCETVVVDHD